MLWYLGLVGDKDVFFRGLGVGGIIIEVGRIDGV